MRILVTGAAGFIGSNLIRFVCEQMDDAEVLGLDNMNDYYDVQIKEDRLTSLKIFPNFKFISLAKAITSSALQMVFPSCVL